MSFGKNRIHATLAKYALSLDTDSDIFTHKWRRPLLALVERLPPETARCVRQELELLELVQEQIDCLERRILERVRSTPTIQLVMSVPGPAEILSIVIDREVGSIDRFPSPHHFAGYSGMVPKVKGSGGKFHHGRMIKQANNYLKWAFIEAANVVVRQRRHPGWRDMYVVHLYERILRRKGHAVAVGAVARYLAEATYWVLKKGEPYREPVRRPPAGSRSPSRSSRGRRAPNMAPSRAASLSPCWLGVDCAAPAEDTHAPRGRIDVCGETALTWKPGPPIDNAYQALHGEEAFDFVRSPLDRCSAFIDVRPPQSFRARLRIHLRRGRRGGRLNGCALRAIV